MAIGLFWILSGAVHLYPALQARILHLRILAIGDLAVGAGYIIGFELVRSDLIGKSIAFAILVIGSILGFLALLKQVKEIRELKS